ncbi:putative Late nodulin [Medicago truncatula]|uniref:Putative Late nodulin n=1 Tax=Medicago truncatula TaxID=3880 RepID=A0A396I7A5_MEDTR|nr:putative Late nodulin [Medicago truncatula]
MAGILKFFYIVIIYVSLFLFVVESERECVTDADCQKNCHFLMQIILFA